MYKIYINETPLLLTDISGRLKGKVDTDKILQARYVGAPKSLFHYIDLLEKNSKFDEVRLLGRNADRLFEDFCGLYKIIDAAGGVVTNDKDEILFIYRMETWDLPKGKIEKGESIEAAALREVEEETGCTNLTLKKKLLETYHTYKMPKGKHMGKRVLKKTYWYQMESPAMDLVPQTEENIEIATWMTSDEFFSKKRAVYRNILDVLDANKQ